MNDPRLVVQRGGRFIWACPAGAPWPCGMILSRWPKSLVVYRWCSTGPVGLSNCFNKLKWCSFEASAVNLFATGCLVDNSSKKSNWVVRRQGSGFEPYGSKRYPESLFACCSTVRASNASYSYHFLSFALCRAIARPACSKSICLKSDSSRWSSGGPTWKTFSNK